MVFGVAALVALLGLGLLLYFWLDWNLYWAWLLAVNVVTYFFFRYDKGQAQREGATRVPEIVLLALVLSGGVVGGCAGMLVRPRHKTHKPVFWIVLAAGAILHLFLLYRWLVA
jgi:uncharacterized membrane protein YsdA (DUF1294 family)